MQCRVNVPFCSSVQGFFFLAWIWMDQEVHRSAVLLVSLGESNGRSAGDSDGVTAGRAVSGEGTDTAITPRRPKETVPMFSLKCHEKTRD